MAARNLRLIVARFVIITGLAVSLFAGSFALVQPSHASASPASYCRAKLSLSLYYYELANIYTDLFASTGDDLYLVEADEAYTKYEEYTHDMWDVC
jgi:hypothetical protein